jgi:hypothetical protein
MRHVLINGDGVVLGILELPDAPTWDNLRDALLGALFYHYTEVSELEVDRTADMNFTRIGNFVSNGVLIEFSLTETKTFKP